MEGFNAAGEDDRLRRSKTTVNLNAEVDLVAYRFTILPHRVDRVLNLACMRLVIGHMTRLVKEGCEVTDAAQRYFVRGIVMTGLKF